MYYKLNFEKKVKFSSKKTMGEKGVSAKYRKKKIFMLRKKA